MKSNPSTLATRAVAAYAVLMWALPLSHSVGATSLSGHDYARIGQLFVLFAASVYWAWRSIRPITPRIADVPFKPLRSRVWPVYGALLAGLILASTWHATYPVIALKELLLFAGLVALIHTVGDVMKQQRSLMPLLRVLAIGGFIYASSVLTVVAMALLGGGLFDPWVALMGFDNPRFLNHVQTVALPLVTIVAVSDANVRWRRTASMTLLLSGMLLFLTYGRATMLALTVGLLTARCAFGRQANTYALRALIPTLLGMGLMWLIYLQWMHGAGFLIEVDQLTKPHHRGHLVGQALKLWRASPWLGVGPMHFSHWEDGDAAHPHNIYAQVLAEYGAPAFVLIVGGATVWLVKRLCALRRAPPAHATTAIGLWGALVGVVVDGGFSGNFVMPMSQLWIALSIGLVIAFVAVHGGAPDHNAMLRMPEPGSRIPQVAASWVLMLGMAVLVIDAALLCWKTPFPSMETQGPIQGKWLVVTTSNPRFWSKGFF